MGEFSGFSPRLNMTGFTALPNEFFDEELAKIDNLAELKVLLATFRRTYGWVSHIDQSTGQPVYKQEDAISYTQFSEFTGLSSPSISSGIDKAIKDGYLVKVKQGNYGGAGQTSIYRVRIKGDNGDDWDNTPPPTPPEPPKKVYQVGHQTYTPLPDQPRKRHMTLEETLQRDIEPNGLATKDVDQDDKDSIFEDFFGKRQTEEQPKQKKERATWKTKKTENWNINDALGYFKDLYESKFNIKFGSITNVYRGKMRQLVEGYGMPLVIEVMNYAFKNWETFTFVPKEPMNFHIFHGWFEGLYKHYEGVGLKRSTREFDQTKHQDRKGVNTW